MIKDKSIYIIKYSYGARYDHDKSYPIQVDANEFSYRFFPKVVILAQETLELAHKSLIAIKDIYKSESSNTVYEVEKYSPTKDIENLKDNLEALVEELSKYPDSLVSETTILIDKILETLNG